MLGRTRVFQSTARSIYGLHCSVAAGRISAKQYLHGVAPLSRMDFTRDSNQINKLTLPHLLMIRTYWRAKRSPYDILGVSKSATAKEIKMAFYREAKKYHPDLHPNDPQTKAKFQEIAAAYELLSDDSKRRMYDSTGFTGESGAGNYETHNSAWQEKHAEDIFNSVQADFDVIREALQSYGEEVRDEINYTVDSLQRGDWKEVLEIAKNHKILLGAVVLPTFLLLRYPPLVFAAVRLIWLGGQAVVAGLLYTGHFEAAAKLLWKQIVHLSQQRTKRSQDRRNRR
jgi:hypothetical protein